MECLQLSCYNLGWDKQADKKDRPRLSHLGEGERVRLIRVLLMFLLILLAPACAAGSRGLPETEYFFKTPADFKETSFVFDLTGEGASEVTVAVTFTPEPVRETRLVVRGADGCMLYSLALTGACPEMMALTSLREVNSRELLFAWRVEGSGGFLGYVLLGHSPAGFGELLREEGLAHGAVSLSGGALEQTAARYGPDSPNSMPAAMEKTCRLWDGTGFAASTATQLRDMRYSYDSRLERDTIAAMPANIEEIITRKALEMDVPPVLVKAIAMVETGGRHYNSDGTVVTGSSGEIGLMQVLPNPLVFTPEEREKLKDVEFNIETGIKTLIEKKMYSGLVRPVFVEPGYPGRINMSDNILESWYFAIWSYNGWTQVNNPGYPGVSNTYQDKVIKYVKSYGANMEGVPRYLFTEELPPAGKTFSLPGKNSGGLMPLEPGAKARVVNASQLNVREKPGTVYGLGKDEVRVLKTLLEGEEVVLLEGPYTNTRSRWYLVAPSGNEGGWQGWAAATYKYDANRLLFVDYLIKEKSFSGIEWPSQVNITDYRKVWNVRFNRRVDRSSINSGSIYVIDGNGRGVDVKVTVGDTDNTVQVVPQVDYRFGETYYLYITENVCSLDGKNLTRPVRMKFTVKPPL